MKKLILCLLMILSLVVQPVEGASVLNYKSKTIYKGSSFTLKVKASDRKETYYVTEGDMRVEKTNVIKPTIKVTSSNTKVAKVTKNSLRSYKITGKKAGSATIKVKVNGQSYSCKVTVVKVPTGISYKKYKRTWKSDGMIVLKFKISTFTKSKLKGKITLTYKTKKKTYTDSVSINKAIILKNKKTTLKLTTKKKHDIKLQLRFNKIRYDKGWRMYYGPNFRISSDSSWHWNSFNMTYKGKEAWLVFYHL